MLVGYGGTVYSLVKTFCVRCAENDSAVLMIAEGNGSHVSVVLPVWLRKWCEDMSCAIQYTDSNTQMSHFVDH